MSPPPRAPLFARTLLRPLSRCAERPRCARRACASAAPAPLRAAPCAPAEPRGERGFAFRLEGKRCKNALFSPPPPLLRAMKAADQTRGGWCGGCAGAVLPGDAQPPAPSGKLRCQARPRSGRQYRSPNGSIIRC